MIHYYHTGFFYFFCRLPIDKCLNGINITSRPDERHFIKGGAEGTSGWRVLPEYRINALSGVGEVRYPMDR